MKWFKRFSGCWINSQWKFPRYQSTSVISTSSKSWRNAKPPSLGVPSRREGPPSIWDTHGISGTVFANPDASSSAPYPQELIPWSSSTAEPLHSSTVEKEWEARTRSRAEMPVWTVSQKFGHLQWGRRFKELWGRPTTTADFGSSFWQIRNTSYVCLLEDKIQDWGRCTCSQFPTEAFHWIKGVGDGWFSGWFKIFINNMMYSNAEFWSTRCEDCSSTEQNHPKFSLQKKKDQSGGTQGPKKRTVSFAEDRLLTWSTSTSGSQEPMILSRIMPTDFTIALRNDDIQEFDSKWDGILFSMTENPIWWYLGRTVQIKSTRVRETQDGIGIVLPGDSSEENSDLIITDSMVKRSIEQNLRIKNFRSQKRKLWKKRRGQESGRQNSVDKEF